MIIKKKYECPLRSPMKNPKSFQFSIKKNLFCQRAGFSVIYLTKKITFRFNRFRFSVPNSNVIGYYVLFSVPTIVLFENRDKIISI